MKRILFLFAMVIFSISKMYSIDVIYFNSGDSAQINVLEEDKSKVYYSYPNESVRNSINMIDFDYIRLGSGRIINGGTKKTQANLKREHEFAGFHGFIGGAAGYQLYSVTTKAATEIKAGGLWEGKKGLLAGATLSVNFTGPYKGYAYYTDIRILPTIGYNIFPGRNSMYLLAQAGISFVSTKRSSKVDSGFKPAPTLGFLIGYRYMAKNHFGIFVETGYQGTIGTWMDLPITFGFVF